MYAGRLVRMALGSMLEILKQTPFVRVPIKSILWGYDHPLIKLGNDVLPVERKLPFEQFGFFVGVGKFLLYPVFLFHLCLMEMLYFRTVP